MAIRSDEDRAFAAAAWASGEKQRVIATWFGYRKPPPVAVAIREFIDKYYPEFGAGASDGRFSEEHNGYWVYDKPGKYGDDRKGGVKEALRRFVEARNAA